MTNQAAIKSFEKSNEQAKVRLEVEKMRMNMKEVKELEFYIERDEMAIKALEEQEPCEDCISRQAVLKAMCDASIPIIYKGKPSFVVDYVGVIETVPPANPQEKTGHWIDTGSESFEFHRVYKCSECGNTEIEYPEGIRGHFRYCPNCGAGMIEPQERSEKE